MPIVVAGAGPVGLYTAICLAKRGYPVEVIDKYIGNFTRPGIVAINAGQTIIEELDKIKVNLDIPLSNSYPETYNINELQKALYQKAKELGVKFTSAHFASIDGHTLKLEDNPKLIDCDLLIDCTGESRAILNYVNSSTGKEIFNIQPIAENPVENHFVAFIKMSKEDAAKLSANEGAKSLVNEVKMQEALRSQGWKHNDLPEWDMRRWETSDSQEVRFCCYFEIPDELAYASPEEQQAWLATLLALKTGETVDFTVESGSLKFNAFKVAPKRVINPIYQEGNYPFPIVACGDAMMSAEYRKGTGITNGIVSANALVNSIDNRQEKLAINPKVFDSAITHTSTIHFNTQSCIHQHEKEVKELYTRRKNKWQNNERGINLERYLKAYSLAPNDEVIKQRLIEHIGKLKEFADAILQSDLKTSSKLMKLKEAAPCYESALNACRILDKNPNLGQLERANICNLQSRICSNLEMIYREQKNEAKAAELLEESIEACDFGIKIVQELQSTSQQKLLEDLQKLRTRLEGKKTPYIEKSYKFKEKMEQIRKELPPTIVAKMKVEYGQALFISGSTPSLGNWQKATRMEYKKDHWEFQGEVPPGTEFKLLVGSYDGEELREVNGLQWENDFNRKMENAPIEINEANFGDNIHLKV